MNKFRYDGSFVITVNGLPYHTLEGDVYYKQTVLDFQANPQNYEAEGTETMKYQDGQWVDISDTDEYKAGVLVAENADKKAYLQAQIDELDKKSIRALREGGVKDETTGQSWLEYYTQQIKILRKQIIDLN